VRAERMISRRVLRATVVVMAALSATACKPMDDVMVMIFGRSMRSQSSFDPYENTRLPAEGSVPFAYGNLPPAAGSLNLGQPEPVDYDLPNFTQADLDAVATGLTNPVAATPESLARGQVLFERNCAICHGARGLSAEAPILPVYPVMMAYNLAMGGALVRSDGYIYGMIRVGRGLMPPYGHQVSHFDRWNIVNYVRQLQATGGAPPVGAPAAAPGTPAPAAPPPPDGGN
jgi:mono/diheme cytochrome c family protein